MQYWVPKVAVCGVHELVGNALIMKGEMKRTQNLRFEELPGAKEDGNE